MRRLMCVMVLAAGCGDDDNQQTPIDAAVDAPVDAPPPPVGHSYYVIDSVRLPTSNTTARELGLDLNGDLTVDNQFGMVLATLEGMGIRNQATATKSVDTGASIMLADLYTTDFTTAAGATFTIYQGDKPVPSACANAQDTTCRRHLMGTGMFSLKAGAPVDAPLQGAFASGTLTAGPGHLTVQIAFGESAPITVPLIGARVKVSMTTATTIGAAILAGAIRASDVDSKLIPGIRDGFQAAVMRDCTMLSSPPACGCAADSMGKTAIGLFDTSPNDCNITVEEVRNNSLIVSLLAPDVTVENTSALSIGFGATAVHAAFVAP